MKHDFSSLHYLKWQNEGGRTLEAKRLEDHFLGASADNNTRQAIYIKWENSHSLR